MELRLFPLNTVLFPGMPIPLNVFEPRYLQLVQECVEQEEPFGISLIREGPEVGGPADPYEVGTTARIEQVAQGMLNTIQLLARGERRVRILELHHDRPYLWAEAEEIEDAPGEAPQELLERGQALLDEFERLRFSSQGGYVRPRSPEPVTTPPGVLADAIGATGAGRPAERQELLETLDPALRLERAVAMFAPLIERMQQQSTDTTIRRWSEPGALN
ncbi:MAG: hypothetical protein F4X25_05225 [Chloroflexi bacterium]|nr:hypothetical protein [Chloroflexota bacterium]